MTWGVFEAMAWAANAILDPVAILIILIGAVVGIVLGAVPGLGGVVGLTLLIPFTFGQPTTYALLLLIGTLGGVVFGGSIPAILMNIPGTPPSVVTTIDGYPMAEQGRGGEALAASATASAVGAVFGLLFAIAVIPFFRQIMVFIGPPEFMIIIVIGLVTVAYVLEDDMVNGLIGIGVGMAMGLHGFDTISGGLRFAFGFTYLYDSVPLIILALGIFAISEMIKLDTQKETIAGEASEVSGDVLEGVLSVFRNWKLTLQSGVIGIIVGFIPAAGGSVATLIAYARAKAGVADDSRFGHGDVRGVIAPESANDSKDGGAILPTVAFAIPGNAVWAIMLGGLLLHGINPGPTVLSDDLNYVYLLLFGLVVTNIATSLIGIGLIKYIVKVTVVPVKIIVPLIVVISLFGAYIARNNPLDLGVVILIGILGFGAIVFSVSRIAILFGLILGPLLETTTLQTIQIAAGDPMRVFGRPVFTGTLVFVTLAVVGYLYLNLSRAVDRPE